MSAAKSTARDAMMSDFKSNHHHRPAGDAAANDDDHNNSLAAFSFTFGDVMSTDRLSVTYTITPRRDLRRRSSLLGLVALSGSVRTARS